MQKAHTRLSDVDNAMTIAIGNLIYEHAVQMESSIVLRLDVFKADLTEFLICGAGVIDQDYFDKLDIIIQEVEEFSRREIAISFETDLSTLANQLPIVEDTTNITMHLRSQLEAITNLHRALAERYEIIRVQRELASKTTQSTDHY